MSAGSTDSPGEPAATAHRSELDLTRARLQAIDAWHRSRRRSEAAAAATDLTREMRLDHNRRMQARRREQAAIVARADEQLRASGDVLRSPEVRVVLAHRNAWLRDKVAARLTEHGLRVVGAFDDGADAAGTIIVEQPELVLVEDRLPTLPGVDLVRRVRTYSVTTFIAVQVLDSEGVSTFVEAGAQAVFTRRIPPVDIADQLAGCLQDGRTLTLV